MGEVDAWSFSGWEYIDQPHSTKQRSDEAAMVEKPFFWGWGCGRMYPNLTSLMLSSFGFSRRLSMTL